MLVAQQIVRDAVRQRLGAGDPLPSEKLMLEEYQIGRGTLREALRLLEYQGLIVLRPGPGGGPVLTTPDGSELANLWKLRMQLDRSPYRVIVEARSALEPMISRLAAERITEATLDQLQATIDVMRATDTDSGLFFQENQRFHELIAHASDNVVFASMVNSLLNVLHGTSMGYDYATDRRRNTVKAHETILAALKSGDPDEAEAAMKRHIDGYTRTSKGQYPGLLDQTITWDRSG